MAPPEGQAGLLSLERPLHRNDTPGASQGCCGCVSSLYAPRSAQVIGQDVRESYRLRTAKPASATYRVAQLEKCELSLGLLSLGSCRSREHLGEAVSGEVNRGFQGGTHRPGLTAGVIPEVGGEPARLSILDRHYLHQRPPAQGPGLAIHEHGNVPRHGPLSIASSRRQVRQGLEGFPECSQAVPLRMRVQRVAQRAAALDPDPGDRMRILQVRTGRRRPAGGSPRR